MEEIIDYVDEKDNVLGCALKHEVKQKKLNYRSVHIYIFNKNHELLICKRPGSKESYPNQWTSAAGGHVKAGESYKDAAARELQEELGINVPLKKLFKLKYIHPRGNVVFIELWGGLCEEHFVFDKTEIVQHKFILIPRLKSEIKQNSTAFVDPFLKLFEKFIK